jgi:hypothetical protein
MVCQSHVFALLTASSNQRGYQKLKEFEKSFYIGGLSVDSHLFCRCKSSFYRVSEDNPSSFLNALMYILKPVDPQFYGDNQAIKLSFSNSLLFVLKQLRVIVIAPFAGL